ncbi:uncharacterized protein LOC111713753 [Eurytemora carolleeae]|uniref:uncharacterized protein LOC111713753 n=1 Tax=Eurytemora carolleeae TaxID=1294199 RepID=UPI000C792EB4|nr:uncharacterized protein LOC111713753 [Eurytemora carolleeae]|eukprot:XP_023344464.1 uncharacterized protein LOC111713753 [Eurytemora affinis]
MFVFLFSVLVLLASGALGQTSLKDGSYVPDNTGEYVHNPAWDLTPFQLWKQRKELKTQSVDDVALNLVSSDAPSLSLVTNQRRPVPAVVQRPAVQQRFANFQPNNLPALHQTVQPAVQHFNPQPVQQFNVKSLPEAKSQMTAADFIAAATRHPDPNFASRSYSYSAPKYAAQVQGSSYSYEAHF